MIMIFQIASGIVLGVLLSWLVFQRAASYWSVFNMILRMNVAYEKLKRVSI